MTDFFTAVACDVQGCEMADYGKADCIANVVDEAIDAWNGWDALYSIRVYHVTHDLDGEEVWEVVHEEFA